MNAKEKSATCEHNEQYYYFAIYNLLCNYAIETAGTWHEMAIELTQEIGRRMPRITTITEDTRETTFLLIACQNNISFHII